MHQFNEIGQQNVDASKIEFRSVNIGGRKIQVVTQFILFFANDGTRNRVINNLLINIFIFQENVINKFEDFQLNSGFD